MLYAENKFFWELRKPVSKPKKHKDNFHIGNNSILGNKGTLEIHSSQRNKIYCHVNSVTKNCMYQPLVLSALGKM